jgi:cytosine/adenosine deaminase-related metal-dependent hydrolase
MTYLKFKADRLFSGSELLEGDQVLIVKESGEIETIINEKEAGENVITCNGILTPGFINTHCHLELSHMKGLIPQKTGLVDFVYRVITQRHFPEEIILEAIEKAEDEMLASGIVAAGDICNNLMSLPQKLRRRMRYYNFIEASGWMPMLAEKRFNHSKNYFDEFSRYFDTTSIAPHAPYSVSSELWKLILPYFVNKATTIHNQETFFEDEFFLKGTGQLTEMYKRLDLDISFYQPSKQSSLQTIFPLLSGAASVILVHNTFTSEHDVKALTRNEKKDQLVSFCLCVNANLYIENALPPIEMFMRNNCHVVLGTDSLASNHQLSLLNEMKTIHENFNAIPLEEILTWATLNGARALQIDSEFGSFEKGKTPGVVLIENTEGLNLAPGTTCKRLV